VTLVYDLRTMQVLFFPPPDIERREVRVISIAEAIGLIEKEKRNRRPKWREYYLTHHDEQLTRQRTYRATHRDQVREYNRQYRLSRKKQKAAPPGQAMLIPEVIVCST